MGPGPPAQESNLWALDLSKERAEPRNHKETQTEQEPGLPRNEGLAHGSRVEDSSWREGYEAARRIMRLYFHELHQGQMDRGESGWIWKHLSEEMLEKGKPECKLGH
eukprot:13259730-Heterocapsa_arctica.AAC.1